MSFSQNAWISGEGMPPYSTDPELSRERHADPDFVNSSEVGDFYLSDQMMTTDAPLSYASLGSSPPKLDFLETRYQGVDADRSTEFDGEEDEPTDDDEASEPNTSGSITAGRAISESTMRLGSFVLAARAESSSRFSSEKLVAAVFDNERVTDINLDNRGLQTVPDACQDLIDHEDLGKRHFKLDLTGNKITRLNKFIYNIGRLEYLSLRLNQIEELTPLIGQFVQLQELHIGHNNLKTLPIELLDLPSLRTLTTYPNDFLDLPEDGTRDKLVVMHPIPSLVELSRRAIAQAAFEQPYAEFERMVMHLIQQFPKLMLSKLLEPILDTVYVGRVCSVCKTPVIEPAALSLSWRKHGEDRSGETIPFQAILCSGVCLQKFHSTRTNL